MEQVITALIDRSIDEWRRRLIPGTRVVQQQGGHIEHTTL